MARPKRVRKGSIESALSKAEKVFAGIDEVGRGCLAGPVFASIVILPYEKMRRLARAKKVLIRDSKTLSASQRAKIVPVIQELASEWYISSASVAEIERLGIVKANFLAMRRALNQCKTPIDTLLIDGNQMLPAYNGHQMTVVKGDSLCFSIAAASILAKQARDHFMLTQADQFPHYGFDHHVGYGTRHHLDMIKKHGICALHRRNFAPIRLYGEVGQLAGPPGVSAAPAQAPLF